MISNDEKQNLSVLTIQSMRTGSTTQPQQGDRTQRLEPVVISKAHVEKTPWEQFDGPSNGNVAWKTLLSAPTTNSNTFTVGIATCQPNGGYLALHRHAQPEIYHIVSGTGTVRVNGQDHRVSIGDVVFIPGNSEHCVINEHEQDEFKWLYCFNVDRFEDVVYNFTKREKFQIDGGGGPREPLSSLV